MFFNTWMDVVRVLVIGTCAYLALVLLLRVSGKRTLSKMNAFDFVVTVALGSTLASVLLSKQIALVEGVVALALLVGLQYVITWLSVRSPTVSRLVKAEPSLLLYQGTFLPEQMRRSRVLETEVQAAVREQGMLSLDQVAAVVLENRWQLHGHPTGRCRPPLGARGGAKSARRCVRERGGSRPSGGRRRSASRNLTPVATPGVGPAPDGRPREPRRPSSSVATSPRRGLEGSDT